MEFLTQNIGTIVISAGLVAIVALAVETVEAVPWDAHAMASRGTFFGVLYRDKGRNDERQ